jgi:MFS superfamily sulfate permease-like transporter
MAALLAFAAAVNFNDPDPVRWIAVYGAACVVSIVIALMGTVPTLVPGLVGGVALIWAVVWARRVPSFEIYTHMFDEWEMKSVTVEEARETCGLLIVAIWMAAIVLRSIVGVSVERLDRLVP